MTVENQTARDSSFQSSKMSRRRACPVCRRFYTNVQAHLAQIHQQGPEERGLHLAAASGRKGFRRLDCHLFDLHQLAGDTVRKLLLGAKIKLLNNNCKLSASEMSPKPRPTASRRGDTSSTSFTLWANTDSPLAAHLKYIDNRLTEGRVGSTRLSSLQRLLQWECRHLSGRVVLHRQGVRAEKSVGVLTAPARQTVGRCPCFADLKARPADPDMLNHCIGLLCAHFFSVSGHRTGVLQNLTTEEFENLEKADGGLFLINVKQHKPASAFGLAKLAVTKLELKWLKAFCRLRKHMAGYETSVGWLFFSGTQARISAHVAQPKFPLFFFFFLSTWTELRAEGEESVQTRELQTDHC
ncbi:uncharacterized protein LOC128632514 [Ictalurus punctatus]|uniref:Uncharacterized protein LOC128629974 n=1 Tax=Ictalurus punctatus TaxID=7998 RepID=A0A9F7R6U5_ICTPU|nr:uncharacterized protein LOC128629974 [Ictalurus punctatus]XP_053535355.1 uncharacterized protein LOC128632514 [Ictalurus punctatus]